MNGVSKSYSLIGWSANVQSSYFTDQCLPTPRSALTSKRIQMLEGSCWARGWRNPRANVARARVSRELSEAAIHLKFILEVKMQVRVLFYEKILCLPVN